MRTPQRGSLFRACACSLGAKCRQSGERVYGASSSSFDTANGTVYMYRCKYERARNSIPRRVILDEMQGDGFGCCCGVVGEQEIDICASDLW